MNVKDLPKWEDCEAACDEGNETPLQRFIYDYEPGDYEECKKFRKQLAEILQ